MTKKLLSLVAVAALTTSAMAYNANELSKMERNTTKINTGALNVISKGELNVSTEATGNALLFPEYFAAGAWKTTIRVINTSDKAVVAKVVFYDGKDSHEVKDFNIYLSAHDEWMGTIANGKLETTDGSAPLERTGSAYPMASKDNPLSTDIDSKYGYFEVIGMVATTPNSNNAHGNHDKLREAYDKFSKHIRTGAEDTELNFVKGVINYNKATYPFVDLNTNITATVTGVGAYNFEKVPNNALIGDVRITDTVNGKDMVMPAVALRYDATNTVADPNAALVYLEGEKANIADVFLNENQTGYNLTDLNNSTARLGANEAYITYGDAEIKNMYAIVTSPFKRVIVSQAVAIGQENNTSYNPFFKGVKKDASGITNWGSYSLTASIYDTDENKMSSTQFSPVTTPTIVMNSEVAWTTDKNGDLDNQNKLPHFLAQAAEKGMKKGYVILRNTDDKLPIPGYITQMIATKAGDTTVTNWIVPATK
jgi:hypothetical protein